MRGPRCGRRSVGVTSATLVLAGGVGLFTASCGGAASQPSSALEKVDMGSPDAALAALDQAEHEVNRLLPPSQQYVISQQAPATVDVERMKKGNMAPPGGGPPSPAPPPPPPAPPPPVLPPPPAKSAVPDAPNRSAPSSHPKQANAEQAKDDDRARRLESDGAGCESACSALASMARAADHVCSLAGATDARCENARERVKNATERVHSTCGSC